MKVLICGPREWPSERIHEIKHRVSQLSEDTLVIAGAARGVDRLAAQFARERGLAVEEFPADWERLGKRAGYARNITMLNQRPSLVIAFQTNGSRGTAHTIRIAEERGITTEVHTA